MTYDGVPRAEALLHDGYMAVTRRSHDGYTTVTRRLHDGYTTVTRRPRVGSAPACAAARCRGRPRGCRSRRPSPRAAASRAVAAQRRDRRARRPLSDTSFHARAPRTGKHTRARARARDRVKRAIVRAHTHALEYLHERHEREDERRALAEAVVGLAALGLRGRRTMAHGDGWVARGRR